MHGVTGLNWPYRMGSNPHRHTFGVGRARVYVFPGAMVAWPDPRRRALPVWGKQAADLGWSTPDLFGAHPKAPAARFSCMGLLLLVNGGRVIAITAETAVIQLQSGARLTYTRRPPEAECVPLWELSHASQDHPTAATTRAP